MEKEMNCIGISLCGGPCDESCPVIRKEEKKIKCPKCKNPDRVIDLGYEGRYACNRCLLQFHSIDKRCGICGAFLFEVVDCNESLYYCDICVTNEGR